VDDIDRAILYRLRFDARISYRQLGEAISLSANAVAERVRRLTTSGTIRGFHTDIDSAAAGARLAAFVDLRLAHGMAADAFEARLRAMPGIIAASLTTGHFDYTLQVAVADEPALVALIESLRAEGASETHSRIILRDTVLRNGSFPTERE